jgi:ATP-dependent exoDNAse (exonuclease V) beta subunit
MSLNERQSEAVLAEAPAVLVSAGAGSGKTRVLTERYLQLLTRHADRVPMDRILTLTFTRKAAQEMRERIARGLEERGLGSLRPELMRAPIGTIHGFCERVLRERALQAGIDPNFRVLDDAEAGTLLEGALDEIFARFWEGTQREREEIVRLLLDFPHRDIREALLAIYRNARTRGLALDLQPMAPASIDAATAALHDAVEELLSLSGTPTWQQGRQVAREAYADLQVTLDIAANFSWDIYDAVTTCGKRLTPSGGPKDLAKAARDAIKAALEGWLAAYLDLGAEPYLRAFGVLLGHLDEVYRQAKDAQGLLDFEDLLLLTRDLLRDEESDVGGYYRAKFRQVMVDEFQDTNPLQFALISAFQGGGHLFTVGDVKQSIYRFIGSDVAVFLAQEERLEALGDAGHRIPMGVNYRSRPEVLLPLNALFARLWGEAESFPFEPLSAGKTFPRKALPAVEAAFWPAEEGDAATLRDREARWIARRILQLTGKLSEPALPITREDEDGNQHTEDADFGDVIILFRASTDIARYEEALRQAGVPHYVISGRGFYQAREVQDLIYMLAALENPCDDFSLAVVLRSPLVGVSDETLYWLSRAWGEWTEEQPYPADHRRSPEFGRLWESIDRVETIPVIPEEDRAALVRFRELVVALQAELPAGQPLDLLDRIIEETGYAVGLLAMEDGEQRFANVQKLREVAADFQTRGIFDLTDFKRYLAQLEELAPREPSAPLDTEKSPVVRLMTIHAAKGLEAPIVFLADMGRDPNKISSSVLLADGRLACKLPTPEGEWAQPAGYRAAVERANGEERREAERLLYVALTRAQEHLLCSGSVKFKADSGRYSDILARLLDLSPAELVGGLVEITDTVGDSPCNGTDSFHTGTEGGDSPPPLEAETDAVGDSPCSGTDSFHTGTEGGDSPPKGAYRDIPLEYDGQSYPIRIWSPAALRAMEELPTPERAKTLLERFPARIAAGQPLPVPTAAGEVEEFTRVIAHLQPLPPARRESPLRVGVNRVICYHKCPRQYWFRYVLRREGEASTFAVATADEPSFAIVTEDLSAEARAEADGTDFGILLHGVLQRVPLDGDLLAHAPAALEEVARERGISVNDGDRQSMEDHLLRLTALPVFPRLQAAAEVHREVRFLAGVGGIFLPGIIDVLARDGDGWWILDYKTGHPSADHARQVGLYALGVHHALGVAPVRVTLAYLGAGATRPLRDEPVTQGLLDDAHRLVAGVGESLRDGKYAPTPDRHCETCPFRSACPAGSDYQQARS